MIYKTHQYGTSLKAKCESVKIGKEYTTMVFTDENGEGHICIYGNGDVQAAEGESGHLIFTKGGPEGGYWRWLGDGRVAVG